MTFQMTRINLLVRTKKTRVGKGCKTHCIGTCEPTPTIISVR